MIPFQYQIPGYSFLTKSAKLKQEANKGIDETSYSFLTKSAKLKRLKF